MNDAPETVTRAAVGSRAWDDFVDAADEAWLWHRYDLQDAIATWPGSQDLSFAVYEPESRGRLAAVVPCRRIASRKGRVLGISVIDSLGGAACRNDLARATRRRVLRHAHEQLIALARHHGAGELTVALSPLAPALRGPACPRVNPLLALGFANTLTQTWMVDLRRGRDAVWDAMEGRARTAVRKAEKSGVTVRRATPGDLDAYYALHVATCGRSRIAPHPRAYFEAIWRDFLPAGHAQVWMAEHGGQVVAAENFGVYKRAAIYWTGAALKEGLAVEASSLVQWTAIQGMIEAGLEWYETGEAFPQAASGKDKGLNDFKKSFGGELYPLYRGAIDMGSLRYRAFRLARNMAR